MKRASGKVILVGAGPGDPALLTLRGRDALAACDAVLYDEIVHPDILRWAPASAERHYVGKKAGCHSVPQDEINRRLAHLASLGRTVVRLKGGDPYIFGRGAEAQVPCDGLEGAQRADGKGALAAWIHD